METATPSAAPGAETIEKLSPANAWLPLPADQWNEDAARHLLRRTCWSAQPDLVADAVKDGLSATLDRLFPAEPKPFPKPKLIENLQEDTPEFTQKIRTAAPEEKRLLQKEARDRSQQALSDMAMRWLQFAAEPNHAALEKWVLFLSDVYVVSSEKVRNASFVYNHHALLRENSLGLAPQLTKAVSRSPAMIQYLDLQESKKDAPNENFARELFELFVLGEGNYTEADIKQAARAFTGYRQQFGNFHFVQNQHDATRKTVFGHTGPYNGDDVIDLAYALPAASVFLPHEMVRFYLTETPLAPEWLAPLGQWWREQRYNLRSLAQRFFGSRLFFDSAYRGNYIKSPVQFYLGLIQDLELDIAPLARRALGNMRQMGQSLFTPPNVRGWVGGRNWINSATLSARRQLVQSLFYPINEANLNADEQAELNAYRAEGHSHFSVETEHLKTIAEKNPDDATDVILKTFLPLQADTGFRAQLREFIGAAGNANQRNDRVRNAIIALLQSPEYLLC